jgi:hypothetical protein
VTRALHLGGLLLLTAAYALLKLQALHASFTDDNVYFYGAALLARGELPYRDFFFAHPPLHLVVPAALFRAFGFSVVLGKLIPAVASVGTGLALAALARVHFGRAASLVAAAAFWFSPTQLSASSDLLGCNLAALLIALALLAAFQDRWIAAGALLGAAVSTALYALPALLIGLGVGRRSLALHLAAGFAVSCALLNLPFLIASGPAYLEGVFLFHLLKPDREIATRVWQLLYENPLLVTSGLACAGELAVHRRTAGWTLAATACALGCGFALQLAALPQLHKHYFAVALPALSLCTAYLASRLLSGLAHRQPALWAAPAAALVAALMLEPVAFSRGHLSEVLRAGERVGYAWVDPPVLPRLGAITRALFWKDHHLRGEPEWGVHQYLWSRQRSFSTAEEIAAYLREHMLPGETLAGASTVAPLLALLSGRALAAHQVDTNAQRFATGTLTDERFLARACADGLRYLVSAPRSYFERERLERWPAVQRHFALERVFADPRALHGGRFEIALYRRVGEGCALDAPAHQELSSRCPSSSLASPCRRPW